MTGINATPKVISQMIIMREAGYTVLSISQKLGFSTRTVQRHITENNAKKGTIKKEVIELAREELTKVITSNPTIREEAAKLITDNIAQSNHLRELALVASEHLIATNPKEAMLVMRGLAAYSTVIKNTSDTLMHSFGVDKLKDEVGELPELIVKELSNQEAISMQEKLLVIYEESDRIILDE